MRVVTFGEIMLRLSPPGFGRFVQTDRFDVVYGGGEANVAASLARFGTPASFVSRVPKHEIGEAAIGYLRRAGVHTGFVARGGDRLGIYFLETGASQRPSKVIYDRAGSAFAGITPDDVDWAKVFEGADWFHWTGITPATGPGPRATLEAACRAARSAGLRISCDLNYRAKLWSVEEARATMIKLMEFVDVCIANEEDAFKCLGIETRASNPDSGRLDEADYLDLARRLRESFGFDLAAISMRESFSATHNGWSAVLSDSTYHPASIRSQIYDVHVIDRVGAGDAFAGGLIHALLNGRSHRDALEFAVAASCLKHTIPGDFNAVSVAEVDSLVKSGGSGRVDR